MLANRPELLAVLEEVPERIGRVFARHAYGMRRWVDILSARIPWTEDPEAKQLLAELVAANARHMNEFRARARAHGVDPDAYVAPPEGELIYEHIDALDPADLHGLAGYAAGSLAHFAQLLETYAQRAEGEDAAVIVQVAADNETARARLAPLAGLAEGSVAEAHEHYRRRELVETGSYADGG